MIGSSLVVMAEPIHDHANCAVMREMRNFSREKLEAALSIANKMRAEYLKPQGKSTKGGPRLCKREPTQPALEAVAVLAS
jgi:hypothetical protein